MSLGAASAVKRGDAETALRFFAFAMRADPDTPLFTIPYKGIKASQKAIADADIKLDRGKGRSLDRLFNFFFFSSLLFFNTSRLS